jgi:hypothetical protein
VAVLAIAGTLEVKTQEAAGYSGFVGKFCDRGLVPVAPSARNEPSPQLTFLATVYFLGKCCQELLINHSIHD